MDSKNTVYSMFNTARTLQNICSTEEKRQATIKKT